MERARKRPGLLVFLCAGLLLLTAAIFATSVARDRRTPALTPARAADCPRGQTIPTAEIDEVVVAARRLLIAGHVVERQGRTYRWTAENTPVVAAVRLDDSVAGRTQGLDGLRRRAIRACGPRIADHSWAVVIIQPGVPQAGNTPTSFLVRTENGWRAYGPASTASP